MLNIITTTFKLSRTCAWTGMVSEVYLPICDQVQLTRIDYRGGPPVIYRSINERSQFDNSILWYTSSWWINLQYSSDGNLEKLHCMPGISGLEHSRFRIMKLIDDAADSFRLVISRVKYDLRNNPESVCLAQVKFFCLLWLSRDSSTEASLRHLFIPIRRLPFMHAWRFLCSRACGII